MGNITVSAVKGEKKGTVKIKCQVVKVRALSNALLVEEAELYQAFLSQRVNVVTVEGRGKSGVPIAIVRDIYDFNRDASEFIPMVVCAS
jgi:hypothetical protein